MDQKKNPKKGSNDKNETKVRGLGVRHDGQIQQVRRIKERVESSPILRSAAAQVLRQIAINAGAQSLNGI